MKKVKQKILRGMESDKVKSLWQEVFYEDSQLFVDYYFAQKVQENIIFVITTGKDEICSMLHLTPYTGLMCDKQHQIHYIVGVATKETQRKQGYMNQLMKQSLRYLHDSGEPYTFLMPANPDIYAKYDFTCIYLRCEYFISEYLGIEQLITNAMITNNAQTLTVPNDKNQKMTIELFQNNIMEEFLLFVNTYLQNHYDIYMKRDPNYYERLHKELMSQHGSIMILRDQGNIVGTFCFGIEDKLFIQEAFLLEPYKALQIITEEHEKKQMIMARIVNLQKMSGFLSFKEKFNYVLQIEDEEISENNGIFSFVTKKENGFILEIQKIADHISKFDILTIKVDGELSIGEVTEMLLGNSKHKNFPKLYSNKKVFINEIV